MTAHATRVLAALRSGTTDRCGLARQARVSDRDLRDAVRALVLSGIPVVTLNEGGYRIAQTAEEIRGEAAIFRSRGAREYERAIALEKHLIQKQERLFA